MPEPNAGLAFDPVPLRERHDGWTVERQREFIAALAECGCITEACARVGIAPVSAYRLRRDYRARSFREAWDRALQFATKRLADAIFSRAINGVAIPHYYKGEQVGEHRRYDERLAMFLLRLRDPTRFGGHIDKAIYSGERDLFAVALEEAIVHQREAALEPDESVLARHLEKMRELIAEAVERERREEA